jgi:hypothetical protein
MSDFVHLYESRSESTCDFTISIKGNDEKIPVHKFILGKYFKQICDIYHL